LYDINEDRRMRPEADFKSKVNQIKENQAINEYYKYTGYDRGHLNPNSFQCGDSRDATFTLTNAAPMDACFNRVQWHQWESKVKAMLSSVTTSTAFLVTGVVPHSNYRIPQREESDQDEQRDYEKVTVPSHVWTALCVVNYVDDEKSFSLAYMGKNQPESFIKVMSVPELNSMLQSLYSSSNPVSIFVDDCFSTKKKSQEMIYSLYVKTQLASSKRLQMDHDVLNTFETAVLFSTDLSGPPSKKPKVTEMKITESFDSILDFYQQTEKMKYVAQTACLLIKASSGRWKRALPTLECQLVPEKSRIAGSSEVYCSSPCLYVKAADGYWCYSGQQCVQCSPLYSAITYKGEKCKADHPCGTYGTDYYWCYKESGSWDYCSPPLWKSRAKSGDYCRANHACAKYGKDENWCYTDNRDEEEQCCTQDDCYSAVNGRTCKPDKPCDYYGSFH
ncbi:hypothetical protein NFI96_015294, partial [Prochilodus magdalenae]